MVDAIPALTTEKSIKLFEEFDVFSRTELESRAEIKYEIYSKAINIEAKTMIDIATKQIIPAVIRYTTVLGDSINTVKTAGEGLIDVSVQLDLLKKASKLLKSTNSAMSKLSKLVEKIPEYAEGRDRAVFCKEKVVPAMEALRQPVDELEMSWTRKCGRCRLTGIWYLRFKTDINIIYNMEGSCSFMAGFFLDSKRRCIWKN